MKRPLSMHHAILVGSALLIAFAFKGWRYTASLEPDRETVIAEIETLMARDGWTPLAKTMGAAGMPATLLTFAKDGCSVEAKVALLGKHAELGGFMQTILGADSAIMRPGGESRSRIRWAFGGKAALPLLAVSPSPRDGHRCTPVSIGLPWGSTGISG